MSNAWDNPTGFAREIAAYYQQLRTSGHWKPATNFTEPKETT
ncbi:hypothetical protein [Microbacterium sp. WCS2018Hpa-9]|nr:hypothetical protein [Microbacterium sp. WCS2018Hpa-9]